MNQTVQPAPLWKRLAASLYDLLPLIALLMIGTAILLPFSGGALGKPNAMPRSGLAALAYQLYLFALIAAYYVWSWHRGGQTIGMRAWRLQVRSTDGSRPSLRQAVLRFFASLVSIAAFGLGLIWMLFDARGRMWHDRWTDTEVMVVPKP